MSTKKQSNPWAALDALMKTDPEPTGPEWVTAEQFGARYGLSARAAFNKLKGLQSVGKMKRWKGLSLTTRRITTKWSIA